MEHCVVQLKVPFMNKLLDKIMDDNTIYKGWKLFSPIVTLCIENLKKSVVQLVVSFMNNYWADIKII